MSGPVIRVAVAVSVLIGAAGVASAVRPNGPPEATAEQPARVPLSTTSLVCPAAPAGGEGKARSAITSVSAPADLPGGDRPGTIAIRALDQSKPLDRIAKRAQPAQVEVTKQSKKAIVTDAEGALAPGAVGSALTRTPNGGLRGLAETRCVSPGSEFWFVGAESGVGRHSKLYVTNADDADARVDVTLYDKQGRIRTEATRSLDVRPHTQLVLELDKLAPTSSELAVSVEASRGRVAAAVRTSRTVDQDRPGGIDWVPSSIPPARNLVIPGIAPGPGPRLLTVAAPGESTAIVDVSVLGANGTFEPAEHGRLEVAPGTVEQVDLSKITAKQAAGLKISSNVPVTAGVRNELVGPEEDDIAPLREVAYTPASPALTGPAVVPATPSGEQQTSSLLLSTTSKQPAKAEVVVRSYDGKELTSEQLSLPAGGTAEMKLPDPKGEPGFLVSVHPRGKAKVYGTRVLTEKVEDGDATGPMVSLWPLQTAQVTAVRLVARPDLGTR